MKKIFITFALFLVCTIPAAALSVKVTAMEDFTTEKPSPTLKVRVLEHVELDNGLVFEDGTVLNGEIFDVKEPTRGKRNATFKFRPTSYSFNGKVTKIKDNETLWAKYAPYKELDAAGMAVSAATFVGEKALNVPFLGQAVSFTKGFVKNPDGNRLKSGAKQIYKDSLFSYVEEGKEITLKKEELFILKFKVKDEDTVETEDGEQQPQTSVESPEIPVNDKSAVPLPDNSAPAEMEQSTIHAVDPYEVLQEVETNSKPSSKNK